MSDDVKTKNEVDEEKELSTVDIMFFKSDTCAFCPRAEEVLFETIADFDQSSFNIEIVNVSEDSSAAEEYGIFALPTIVIGGVSVTGIPEPQLLLKMIMGAKIRKRKVFRSERFQD